MNCRLFFHGEPRRRWSLPPTSESCFVFHLVVCSAPRPNCRAARFVVQKLAMEKRQLSDTSHQCEAIVLERFSVSKRLIQWRHLLARFEHSGCVGHEAAGCLPIKAPCDSRKVVTFFCRRHSRCICVGISVCHHHCCMFWDMLLPD